MDEASEIGGAPLISMVMLLRDAHCFTELELRRAAEKAWRTGFTAGGESKYFVMNSGARGLVKAGPHFLGVLSSDRPYLGRDPREYAAKLPQRDQREAWSSHSAWTSIDYVKGGQSKTLEYSVIAKVLAELIDSNCTGVYIPGEKSLMPNDESLYRHLQELADLAE